MNFWPFSTIAKLREDNTLLRTNLNAAAAKANENLARANKAESALAQAKADFEALRKSHDALAKPTAAKPRAKKAVK